MKRGELALMGIIGAIVLGVIVVSFSARTPVSQAPIGDIPPFTPEIQQMLVQSKGFSALISYTDYGFEPADASIKLGETVRFTNNSSEDLWVAARGDSEAPLYGGKSECGTSALDTCRALKPKEFWEFTFDKAGTWFFINNLDKERSGVIRVSP